MFKASHFFIAAALAFVLSNSLIASETVEDTTELSEEQIQVLVAEIAAELEVDANDLFDCPCGGVIAEVPMSSPPWNGDSLELVVNGPYCTLRVPNLKKTNVLIAFGTRGGKQTNCWVDVGDPKTDSHIKYKPSPTPPYDKTHMGACYNLIQAKARQWYKSGKPISHSVVNLKTNKAVSVEINEPNDLNCPQPVD